MDLSSTDLKDGKVPVAHTCDGSDVSPQLSWNAPPADTRSLALIVTDPDAPSGTFTHWVLFDLPPTERSLPQDVPQSDQLADGARQGGNDFGRTGYGGPCPPHNSDHRYIFALYALDTTLDLPAGASRKQVEAAMRGHILSRGELTARYRR
ncbi:MAG TPA: YbhB/YbcL family Raf kinase inhibitor-like protein [Terracidiphilus sp.]|nr:YbhB/YbcL family Raf kinase inhibitor-like protein [Terracidiphilus sp.]